MAGSRRNQGFQILVLSAGMLLATAARSDNIRSDPSEPKQISYAYLPINDEDQKLDFLMALADAGESSTNQLVFNQQRTTFLTGTTLYLYTVQDRGAPRGEEFPTYVFRSEGEKGELELTFKTHAGKSLFMAENHSDESECWISAEQGWTDICLANTSGKAAPDLEGHRNDFWSDLLKLLGL